MDKIKDNHQLLKRLGLTDPHDFKKLWELVSSQLHSQTTSSELLFIFIEELNQLQEAKTLELTTFKYREDLPAGLTIK